ncbi:malonyl-ACP O-methyltransferase BioC [Vreelandella massiliensis]|uniref:malonyl-ACP O-methyltransferase BioC n=1 Tax=Vreelandella massiliensis TaxID=1816686 RepID=UPI00096A4FD8|nr:malonyl-ACP O-methyltransferase BioC [Halomonas massiliensis]
MSTSAALLEEPASLWQAKVAHAFSRAAPHYDRLASAQRHIGESLWEGLPETATRVLDLGCGTGYWSNRLASRYPHARVTGLDIAPGMLAHARVRYGTRITWQQGDAETLPFEKPAFDVVFSNLAIQWCRDNHAVMRALKRVLSVGGQAHITTLLPGTLAEVAFAWQRPEALLPLPGARELHGIIESSGLVLLRQSIEPRTFYYPDLHAVMASIKGVGAQVARADARLTRAELAAAKARFETLREPQGLPVSYHCFTLQLENPQ